MLTGTAGGGGGAVISSPPLAVAAADVDGFGVDGADGVDAPEVVVVADVLDPSLVPFPPLRP